MFHTYIHIYSSHLHQTQSLTHSLKSNQDYTFHSVFLFPLPIFFKALSVLHTYPGCEMIFDCSVTGHAEKFVSQYVDNFVIGDAEEFVSVGIGDFVAEGFVQSGAEGFGGAFLADLVDHHPSPLLHVLLHFANGQCSPHEHFSVACLGIVMAQGIAVILGCSSVLMVGAGVETGVGGIVQSFLVSNRFSDAKPALGQGVPCLTWALGIFSSGGGLSLMDLVVGHGTSANCPVASLCIVTGIDSAVDLTIGVCVLTMAIVGVGAVDIGVKGVGWVITLTLYLLLVIIVFFFCYLP